MLRSWFFVPGDRPEKVAKAPVRGADAVIFDLEDGVAPCAKAEARRIVAAALTQESDIPRYVRVNALDSRWVDEDIEAVVRLPVAGFVLPKAERPEEIRQLVKRIAMTNGLDPDDLEQVEVVPLLETALGIENAFAIAKAGPWVRRLAFGALDFMLDLGTDVLAPDLAAYARARIVIASRAARLEKPVDSVCPEFRVLDSLTEEAEAARRLGFGGKLVIHPRQVEVVNRVFQPTEEELARAARVVSAYEAALAQGIGSVEVDGRMVDRPVYEQAGRILERSGADEVRG